MVLEAAAIYRIQSHWLWHEMGAPGGHKGKLLLWHRQQVTVARGVVRSQLIDEVGEGIEARYDVRVPALVKLERRVAEADAVDQEHADRIRRKCPSLRKYLRGDTNRPDIFYQPHLIQD